MTEKTITIDNHEVTLKATAALPRLYRMMFQRDIFSDMSLLETSIKRDAAISAEALEIYEDIAYTMAKHADNDIPDDPEEWLEQFEMFSIYQILPHIVELWGLNTKTNIEPKKKRGQAKES